MGDTQTDDEAAAVDDGEEDDSSTATGDPGSVSDTEVALARQEDLLAKLLESQDQTNESMRERMTEAQEQMSKLMSHLNSTSKNKQELDSRLRKLDDRLEIALKALEKFNNEEERDRQLNTSRGSVATPGAARRPNERQGRPGSSSRGYPASIPEERRSNMSRASSRGGYTATYEQPSRVTPRPSSRMSSQKETSSAVRSGSRDTVGVAGAPGAGDQSAVVFPNMEYERQSMISQIPASDLVSIHSQNPDARSATNISLGGVPDDSAASVVSSSNTDYKRSSARPTGGAGGSAAAHRQQSFNPDLSSIRSQEENTSFIPRPMGTSNSIAEENSFQQAPPAPEEREEGGSVVEQPSQGSLVEQPSQGSLVEQPSQGSLVEQPSQGS